MTDLLLTTEYDIAVEFMEGPSAIVAMAATADGGFVATGEAKLRPDDTYDEEIGKTLALGRALEALSEVMIDYAIKRGYHRE